MTFALHLTTASSPEVLQEIVLRFVDAAQQRSEYHLAPRRRAQRRYHRSWPLAVAWLRGEEWVDMSVAMHNASLQGIAFLTPRAIDPGTTVYIRLFWYDERCPRVPAIVRHSTPTREGYLIGCEFALNNVS